MAPLQPAAGWFGGRSVGRTVTPPLVEPQTPLLFMRCQRTRSGERPCPHACEPVWSKPLAFEPKLSCQPGKRVTTPHERNAILSLCFFCFFKFTLQVHCCYIVTRMFASSEQAWEPMASSSAIFCPTRAPHRGSSHPSAGGTCGTRPTHWAAAATAAHSDRSSRLQAECSGTAVGEARLAGCWVVVVVDLVVVDLAVVGVGAGCWGRDPYWCPYQSRS
jgi:hypothetical protein